MSWGDGKRERGKSRLPAERGACHGAPQDPETMT